MKVRALVVAALIAGIAVPSWAQPVTTGDRIRFTLSDPTPFARFSYTDIKGKLVRLTPDTVVIAIPGTATPVSFDRWRGSSLSVSRGRVSRWSQVKRAGRPLLFFVPASLFIVSQRSGPSRSSVIAISVFAVTPLVMQAMRAPGERWESVPLTPVSATAPR
jgi:hypothetical protein